MKYNIIRVRTYVAVYMSFAMNTLLSEFDILPSAIYICMQLLLCNEMLQQQLQ